MVRKQETPKGHTIYRAGNKLYLKIKEGSRKLIGELVPETRELKVLRSRRKHLLRVYNGFGFNKYILDTARTFDTVTLMEDGGTYHIPREWIVENGKIWTNEHNPLDEQYIVPMKELIQFKDA